VPLLLTIAGVLVAATTVAAWYFFLRAPSPAAAPEPEPTTIAVATPAPTPEPSVEPTVEPTAAPTEEPPAATPPPAPVATPTPVPRPTPTPRPTPATTPPAAPAGDGRALLQQGSLPEAARAFAASLAPARGRYSLQLLVACAPENVTKAVSAAPSDELFILPVSVKGRACYRLCWGVFDGRPAAEAALSSVPAYFRQGGVSPRVAPLGELLP
jgi:septal ring-binding cell division protein DamX